MSRTGSTLGLLYDLHADGCDGTEYSACRPVVVPDSDGAYSDVERGGHRASSVEVVIMAWCSECNAAEWVVV